MAFRVPLFGAESIMAALALLLPAVHAQNLSIDVVGGGSLTDSFPTQNFPEGPPGSIGIRFYSSEKDYIVGAMLEYRFTPHWSVKVDGLFRTLHGTFVGVGVELHARPLPRRGATHDGRRTTPYRTVRRPPRIRSN